METLSWTIAGGGSVLARSSDGFRMNTDVVSPREVVRAARERWREKIFAEEIVRLKDRRVATGGQVAPAGIVS